MLPLLLALLALAAAPLLDRLWDRHPVLQRIVDVVVVVVVVAVVALTVLPYGLEAIGWPAVPALAGGALFASLLHRIPGLAHGGAWLAIGALLLHALVDGAALAAPGGHGHEHPLAAAVLVHTLPVGVATWRIVKHRAGAAAAAAVLAATAACTAVGFWTTTTVTPATGGPVTALLLCALAGALLHVLGHLRTHDHDHDHLF